MFEDLIGRDHAAGVLRAEITRAAAGHGGLVLVAGEPGIGKTALVPGSADAAAWATRGARPQDGPPASGTSSAASTGATAHLRATVTTGTMCAYRPGPEHEAHFRL